MPRNVPKRSPSASRSALVTGSYEALALGADVDVV